MITVESNFKRNLDKESALGTKESLLTLAMPNCTATYILSNKTWDKTA